MTTFVEQERLQGFEHGVLSTLALFDQAVNEITDQAPVTAHAVKIIADGIRKGLTDAFEGEPKEEAPKRFSFAVIDGGKV